MGLARALSNQVSASGLVESVWRGTIVEVRAIGDAWVEVPALSGDEPLGPLPVFGALPTRGAMVLVLAVGGRRDDLVILPPAA